MFTIPFMVSTSSLQGNDEKEEAGNVWREVDTGDKKFNRELFDLEENDSSVMWFSTLDSSKSFSVFIKEPLSNEIIDLIFTGFADLICKHFDMICSQWVCLMN